MKSKIVLGILGFSGLTIFSGCVVPPPPPPPPAATVDVEVGVPDDYVWDGYEYVGWVGDQYYYLGPGDVWIVCDPVRLGHFHDYIRVHPDWHEHYIHNDRYRRDYRGHVVPHRSAPIHRDGDGHEGGHDGGRGHDDRDH